MAALASPASACSCSEALTAISPSALPLTAAISTAGSSSCSRRNSTGSKPAASARLSPLRPRRAEL